MGNKYTIECLIGMTVPEAEKFIKKNKVYWSNGKTRITSIAVVNIGGMMASVCIIGEIDVIIENEVIMKIVGFNF